MNGRSNAIIYCQGEYSLPSDGTYVEMVEKSVDPVFIQGVKNEISVERLHDNLIKLSFYGSGTGKKSDGILVPDPFAGCEDNG